MGVARKVNLRNETICTSLEISQYIAETTVSFGLYWSWGGGGMNIFLNRDKVRITYCVSFANLVWKMNHVFALNIFSPNPSLETPKLFKY